MFILSFICINCAAAADKDLGLAGHSYCLGWCDCQHKAWIKVKKEDNG